MYTYLQKHAKKLRWGIFGIFLLMNVVAYFHAYRFTHFSEDLTERTLNMKEMGIWAKINTLIFGIKNPKPINIIEPNRAFKTVSLQSRSKTKQMECWHIQVDSSKGTVLIFHGFRGNKSTMLDKSEVFNHMGYSTFLVDFVGTGGSEGTQTTIGYHEAEDVKVCLDYIQVQGEKSTLLFGTSMGAAAILRAAEVYQIQPTAAILECPFGSIYQTTYARFEQMKVPTFPMASLLLFWGGVQNGFWVFSHNPQEYAKSVLFPTLLLQGKKDKEVSREETAMIFESLKGKKTLHIFPEAAHENYLIRYEKEWIEYVNDFLKNVPHLE